jgi:hypothetical protein
VGLKRAYVREQGGVIDEKPEQVKANLQKIAGFVAASFGDPKKAHDDLIKFAKMNENRIYSLLKVLMNPQTDLKTMVKTNVSALSISLNALRRVSDRVQAAGRILFQQPERDDGGICAQVQPHPGQSVFRADAARAAEGRGRRRGHPTHQGLGGQHHVGHV